MRIYLPATAADLTADSLTPRQAHAVTKDLAAALPDEDEEGLEVSASLCAADSSLVLLAASQVEADRRVVVAADVEAYNVREVPVCEDVLPGTVELLHGLTWDEVTALLVDEASVEADVRLARTGDEEAFERVAEADLLWYDVSERSELSGRLGH